MYQNQEHEQHRKYKNEAIVHSLKEAVSILPMNESGEGFKNLLAVIGTLKINKFKNNFESFLTV